DRRDGPRRNQRSRASSRADGKIGPLSSALRFAIQSTPRRAGAAIREHSRYRELMKKLRCIFFILLPLVCAAQDEQSSAIKVTTTLHEDGSKTVTKLDPDQHTSEATTFNSADKMQQRIVYDLDDQNQATAGKVYAANGTLLLKCVYKRDSSNRVYEEDDYTPDDKLA